MFKKIILFKEFKNAYVCVIGGIEIHILKNYIILFKKFKVTLI